MFLMQLRCTNFEVGGISGKFIKYAVNKVNSTQMGETEETDATNFLNQPVVIN